MSGLRDDGGSAQDAAYWWLKQHIARSPRHEGTFLSEAEVARETGTSRTPVREALLRLEAEGFLQIVPKKGVFVPPITDEEVRAVMQARELVEDWCVRQVTPAGESLIGELESLLAEQERVIGDPVAFIELDRAFHRAIVRRAGNPVLAEFYESLRDRQVRMGLHAVASEQDRARAVLDEHAAIVAALRTREARAAGDALHAHLASTRAALHLPDVAGWSGLEHPVVDRS
ncbi:GntR family transcriptional regulator [Spongiactinospora gelatinilytica]|uniref:GntR family transcriptional regulator n=1 Tax=Spongiactinospora gelatinilytica TaxID=2666298 RepID=A0A2W2F3R4_9ACTN|nr:GntR family transcriptional regulator [Spongiactinospora gelatinilytica]PZG31636.1 GntR family transcriptional regulator [Spongiactinospora gelatinilytica]